MRVHTKIARPKLGRLLRDLRTHHGWTLKEMSARTDIPVSTLSKVERGVLSLTYDKLLRVSEGLRIPASELFAPPTLSYLDSGSMVTARRSLGYLSDAKRVTTKTHDCYYMCPELRRKRMIPVIGRVYARSLEECGELVRHSGEEYIYVLEGTIAVHTFFYDPVILEKGESIYIDCTMGRAYVAERCEAATFLAIRSSTEAEPVELERGERPGPSKKITLPSKLIARASCK